MQARHNMIGYQLNIKRATKAYRNIIITTNDRGTFIQDSRTDGEQTTYGYCKYFALDKRNSSQITGLYVPGKCFISYNKKIYEERFVSDII